MALLASRFPSLCPPSGTLCYFGGGQSNFNGINNLDSDAPPNQFTKNYDWSRTKTYWKRQLIEGVQYTQTSPEDNATFEAVRVESGFGSNLHNTRFLSANGCMFILRDLEKTYTNEIRVMRVGEGATGFASGSGAWADGGILDTAWIDYTIFRGMRDLLAENRTLYLLPVYWNQGEQDATQSTNAQNYQGQMASIISRVRTTLNAPTLPWIMARLSNNTNFPHRATIQAAQDAIAASDPNVHLINTNDIEFQSDNIHYTESGFKEMARRYLAIQRQISAVTWGGFE